MSFMKVEVTSFTSPFSFFCIPFCDVGTDVPFDLNSGCNLQTGEESSDFSQLSHGQYIAVLWNSKWVRGIVNMENQMLIWLVDYGTYLRANETTKWAELLLEYKKVPSKVFEASVHGVMPVNNVLNEKCELTDEVGLKWTPGAVAQARAAVESANVIHIQPVAVFSNNYNDVILVNLYLDLPEKGPTNLLDELDCWPRVMKKTEEGYVKNLANLYKGRRRHRASTAKPNFPDIAVVTPTTTLADYSAICDKIPKATPKPITESCPSTVVQYEKCVLTPEEIKKFSNMYLEVAGREYNLLNVIMNKIKDLQMCEMYKDYDVKCMGRGVDFKK